MQPITMTLPLRGEWMTPNTPGSRVPSHGTDLFGARYAYDFIQVDWTRSGLPAYRGSLARYLFRGDSGGRLLLLGRAGLCALRWVGCGGEGWLVGAVSDESARRCAQCVQKCDAV